jgi:hypothetical protein
MRNGTDGKLCQDKLMAQVYGDDDDDEEWNDDKQGEETR